MNSLSRFLIAREVDKKSACSEEIPTEGKSLQDVLEFDAKGEFDIEAKISDIKLEVYKACPRGSAERGGQFCGRRLLPNKRKCPGCGIKAESPVLKMYIRIELQDLKKAYIAKTCTMFNNVAERFMGMGCEKFEEMKKKEPQKLAELLHGKLGAKMIFHVNVKASKDPTKYKGWDWTISNFGELSTKEEVEEEEEDDDEGEKDEEEEELNVKAKTEVKDVMPSKAKKAKKN